jgi:aerobic-type carbon monoxide dehydrogenase small subunit (CoxS/CutS family)
MSSRKRSKDRSATEADGGSLSRRNFLKGAGGAAVGGALTAAQTASAQGANEPEIENGDLASSMGATVDVTLSINGRERRLRVEPRTTLLSTLRHQLTPPLTGTKLVCDRGNCGACTVLVDDRPSYACLLLAADLEGRSVRTIESLGEPGALSPVQEAFWQNDASMCGFCTPGFVVSVTAALEKNPKAGLSEIRSACSGNVCRCGTYPQVFRAALDAGRAVSSGGGR